MTSQEREALILEAWSRAGFIARRLAASVPKNIPVDDLISDGMVRVLAKIDGYDESLGKFSMWANFNLRAGMIDAIRKWAHRRDDSAGPTPAMCAVGELEAVLAGEILSPAIDATSAWSLLDDLRPRHKQVMQAYYRDGLSMLEIGTMLGVSESRICQIHKAALAKLRALLCPTKPQYSYHLSSKAVA